MKRLLIFVSLLLLLATVVTAAETSALVATQSTETVESEAERKALIESLHKGIIPVTPDMTYDEFKSYMNIIDESEGKLETAKFETFLYVIEYYYYGKISAAEAFANFAATVDGVDINNMDETYKALFATLDKFSYYLNAEEAKAFFSPNSSKGIGIKMIWKDADGTKPSGIYVDEVAIGSPAQQAGIAVGDRIVEFNSNNVRGLGFDALGAYNSLVAPEAETLTVKLERDGEEKEYTIVRQENRFSEYSITLYPEKNLIYLDINSFMYDSTVFELSTDLASAWDQGYRHVIIDLQDNSGGDVYVASSLLSKFTPKREKLFSMGRDGNTNSIPFYSSGNGYSFESIRILVNGGTASSAEIFADTLRNVVGAKIIGTKTFGKGVAQSVLHFEDGAACGVTTYVAYDKKGNTYNEVGLMPNVVVSPKVEKNQLPSDTPTFTALNYSKARPGAENSTVLGLEIRLEAIGFLAPEEVDGIWKDATTRAVAVFQIYCGYESTGILDDPTYFAIIDSVRQYESTYYYTYTAFDYAYRFIPFAK